MPRSQLTIGLISGTSVDGVDCALVDCAPSKPKLIASLGKAYPDELRKQILTLCRGDDISLRQLGNANVLVGELFAEAALELLDSSGTAASAISAIGSHGQTVWHEPDGAAPFTLQLGNPSVIAERTGITTVGDLRSRDIAAGGQGAPLAPLIHRELFHSELVDRAIVNIGGIANLTALPRQGRCLAFDTGPGNVLMDYWIDKHRHLPYDHGGSWAAEGQFNLTLLNALLDEAYFSRPLPKSTGRELFNGDWLENRLATVGIEIAPQDVQATLLTFTVTTILSNLTRYFTPQEIYVCGGGAHNEALMKEMSKMASDYSVSSTEALGTDPDWVEAMAFAWMASKTIAGEPIDTTPFTGARSPVIMGGIYSA